MSIFPLPVFEADADPHHRQDVTDADVYERLEAPRTIVVRFGAMKLIGEFPYGGDAKPGCGSKLVVRTHRGTELGEMLTTTCENAGCAKSVTRKELLEYVDNSGGRDFPFHRKGRVLRVATVEDLNRHSALQGEKTQYVRACRTEAVELELDMKLVDVEPILGGELLTFYYMAEGRIDFRELVKSLAAQFHTRIEMRQVGARDEARLTADYERCGQYCCCKNFLKVLKPVSMGSAKLQKATLDPLKISGRCGRLMCCLRYEDQTYKELKANLPRRKSRVGTSEGPGIILDTKILVQLALVQLEADGREIAVPIEELMDPNECPDPSTIPEPDPLRGLEPTDVIKRSAGDESPPERRRRRRRGRRKDEREGPAAAKDGRSTPPKAGREGGKSEARRDDKPARPDDQSSDRPSESKSGRRRRRRRRGGGQSDAGPRPKAPPSTEGNESSGGGGRGGSGGGRRRRRRGRRGRGGSDSGGGGGLGGGGE